MDEPKRTLKQKAYLGLKEYLAISCYLWLVFSLFVIWRQSFYQTESLSSRTEKLYINALALGKVTSAGGPGTAFCGEIGGETSHLRDSIQVCRLCHHFGSLQDSRGSWHRSHTTEGRWARVLRRSAAAH